MRQISTNPIGYEADENKVFDYATPHYDEQGQLTHLYATIIYLGITDSIDNYIEVDKPEEPEPAPYRW